ncbi:hypothetical protein KTT_20220 [Tengunoibacter tsumagoiensis]|uniref:Uncharacterized protein n=1 Tax=Tengunoibacter tsumagoiensis TaxID=2014871 RepID=A0A401ZZA5_9CHLR|nr:hypothetical protein KTT_20220 [Tengunoibacter tsumagoiensis]
MEWHRSNYLDDFSLELIKKTARAPKIAIKNVRAKVLYVVDVILIIDKTRRKAVITTLTVTINIKLRLDIGFIEQHLSPCSDANFLKNSA